MAKKRTDFLMWVGSVFYPTLDSFVDEAVTKERGVCKRLGKLPHALVPGKSRIFLTMDEGLNGDGFVFGYFIPDHIEYLAKSEDDIPVDLYDRVEWVDDWDEEDERECGDRREGMYCVSYALDGTEPKGKFVIFKNPRSLAYFDPERKHFRGLLQIDYGSKLMRAPGESMVVPPSCQEIEKRVVDDDELLERMMAGPSLSRVAQEIALETHTKKTQVLYRYNVLVGKVKLKTWEPPIHVDLEENEAKDLESKVARKRKKFEAKKRGKRNG